MHEKSKFFIILASRLLCRRGSLVFLRVVCFLLLASFFSMGISLPKQAATQSSKEEASVEEDKSKQEIVESYYTAKVTKILFDKEEELPGGNKQRIQSLVLKILSGNEKGKERMTVNVVPDNPAFAIVGQIGKKYLITKIESVNDGQEDYFIVDYYREPFVWFLISLFLVVLVVIAGFKGVRTVISLLIVIAFIAFLLIPGIEKGINPLLSAVIISILATGITMLLVAGKNLKSLAATLGTGIGVMVSGLIATFIIKYAPLSGLSSTESMILWGNRLYDINFKGLLAAAMIVSCLGAVMDVAISIASSIQEIRFANPEYSLKQLYNSGMNVGKDIIGTMTNTLVLAYTGMALPLLLLISHEKNPVKFLNLELVVSEVTAAIAGSVGLIIAVPFTAFLMSFFVTRKKKENV